MRGTTIPALLVIVHDVIVTSLALGFDPKQKIAVTGKHEFIPPGPGDQRGPCPALNALANHNFLPHDGIGTIPDFIAATNQVFGMGLDLSTILAVMGAALDGNLFTWSIGGPSEKVTLGPVFSQPLGIAYSHNKYEGDASATRCDLFLCGQAHEVHLPHFRALYDLVPPGGNYNTSVLNIHHAARQQHSISNNAYFFNGPISGFLVVNIEYYFMFRMFANHTAEYPDGYLNGDVLKSFFGCTGHGDTLNCKFGHERIPENWYRRAIGEEYGLPFVLSDLIALIIQYPQFLAIGGNTGTVDSFTGVDLSNLTGGVYDAKTLVEGNNLACFLFQNLQVGTPDILREFIDAPFQLSTVKEAVKGMTSKLGCPKLANPDPKAYDKFPGYKKLKSDATY